MTYDEKMPIIPFRIDSATKDALKRLAEKRGKAVQVVVRDIINEYLESHGYIITTKEFNI